MRRLPAMIAYSTLVGLSCGGAQGGALSDWFESLSRYSPSIGMMVPCCAEHDALYADQWRADENGNLVVVVTGAGPRNHWWAPIGREYLIEDYKTIKHSGNPTGHSLLFVSPLTLQAICFVYGDGV